MMLNLIFLQEQKIKLTKIMEEAKKNKNAIILYTIVDTSILQSF